MSGGILNFLMSHISRIGLVLVLCIPTFMLMMHTRMDLEYSRELIIETILASTEK
nr:MAG TPA: hypothetical protein [Caudoviricetes sp.]